MTTHREYPKIKRLGCEETEGILDNYVIIQEKIDGANLSVWIENGEIYVGSRTRIVGGPEQTEGFRGAVEYCRNHPGIRRLLNEFPRLRLYGEWLVRHSIPYPEDKYNKFYLFDAYNEGSEMWMNPINVSTLAREFNIESPKILVEGNVTPAYIESIAGTTHLGGELGEGVVIKAHGWRNKFGDFQYAKYVTEAFKEKNAEVFGEPQYSDPETKFVASYVTFPRLMKLVNKIEQQEDRKVTKLDTGRIFGMMYHDCITEEIWEFLKKTHGPIVNFTRLNTMTLSKTKEMWFQFLDGNVSSAFIHNIDDNEKGNIGNGEEEVRGIL